MGSCGTAVTILLTRLLSHGLATHNACDTVLLGTFDALLWNHISQACKRNHPVSCQDNDYALVITCILQIRLHSASIRSILHPTLPLLRMYIGDLTGESATCRCQKHHTPSKAHAMGSCGTAVTILLTRLLSHGLATHNWPTMNVILFCWAPLIPCFGITSLKLAREITPSPAKIMIALVSFGLRIIQLLFILFFILHSLSFKCTSMKSGVRLWDRDLQNFGPKAKNRRLFLLAPVCDVPWCATASLLLSSWRGLAGPDSKQFVQRCIPVSSGRGQILSVSKIIVLFETAFLEQNSTFGVWMIFTHADNLKRRFLPLKRHFIPLKRHFLSVPSSFGSEATVFYWNLVFHRNCRNFVSLAKRDKFVPIGSRRYACLFCKNKLCRAKH